MPLVRTARREASKVRPAAVIYVLAVGGYRQMSGKSVLCDAAMCGKDVRCFPQANLWKRMENKMLLVTRASLLGTRAFLVVARNYS